MIAQALESRRKCLSMPYTTLGRRCGLSTNHVYGILHYGHPASFDALEAIAQALGGSIRLVAEWPTTPEEMRLERARDKASREGTDADALLRAGPTTIWLE